MPRKPEGLTKITVRIKQEDADLIDLVYSNAIGQQKAIRTIINQHCNVLRRNLSQSKSITEESPECQTPSTNSSSETPSN